MMKNHLLLIALLISVQLSASTAGIQFESLNTMDGLSQNTVTSILQDQYGFLWFGTRDGLSWYDGHSFRTFKNTHLPGNPFPDNYVRALSLGNDNTIWIGAGGGVFRFSYAEDRVVRLPLPLSDDGSSPSPIECIETADDGDVLIMTRDKIYVVKAGTDEIILLYSSSDVVLRKIISVNDRIYFSGNDGGIRYTDDEFETIYYVLDSEGGKIFGDDQITFILPRPDGSLFVGMKRSGVGYIDPRTQVYRKLALGDESLGDVYVRSILQNGESELWIGTESGLFIYDLMSGSSQHLKSSYYDDKSLSDNAIYSLFKDYCGGIWVGTFFGGLNYLSPYGKVISNYYPTGETGSIKGKRVRDIVPDDNGCFWVGTEDAGLYHFNPRTSEFKFFEPSQEFTNIHDLQMIGSDLWVCTFGRGIKVIDTMTGRMRSYTTDDGRSNVGSDFIFSLAQADDGKLWDTCKLPWHNVT